MWGCRGRKLRAACYLWARELKGRKYVQSLLLRVLWATSYRARPSHSLHWHAYALEPCSGKPRVPGCTPWFSFHRLLLPSLLPGEKLGQWVCKTGEQDRAGAGCRERGGQEFRQQEVVTVHGEMRPVPPRGLRLKGNLGSPLPLGLAKWAVVLGSGLNFGLVWGGLGPIWKGAARTCRCPGDTMCSWLVQRMVVKALCVPSLIPSRAEGASASGCSL